ncbi:MAG: ABC transporter [Actinomycetales bacterium]|nr:MAG: ABC transporter [Actinomycetales bacterium]
MSRARPLPAGAGLARMLVERNAICFRREWIPFVTGFLEPVFYLFSLGIGLGALVGSVRTASGEQVPYAAFVAPAMLATSAMNAGVLDSTFNVFFKLKYTKLYDSVLATRMGPRDVAVGEVTWSLLRGGTYAAVFLTVAWGAGLVPSLWGLLALPAAVFVALAFSAVGMFATTFMRSWVDFDMVTLVVQPMFLLSATFFPLAAYPGWAQVLVQATPLYHGVALCRALTLGEVYAGLWWHVVYLVVLGGLGVAGAARRLDRLLLA